MVMFTLKLDGRAYIKDWHVSHGHAYLGGSDSRVGYLKGEHWSLSLSCGALTLGPLLYGHAYIEI